MPGTGIITSPYGFESRGISDGTQKKEKGLEARKAAGQAKQPDMYAGQLLHDVVLIKTGLLLLLVFPFCCQFGQAASPPIIKSIQNSMV
jgi:hypothetical protein